MTWVRASDVCARIADAREAAARVWGRDVTQEEFGGFYGVTGQTVSDTENGRTKPSRAGLKRLAERLGIPLAAFGEGGPMPSTLLRSPVGPRTGNGPTPVARREADAVRADIADFMRDHPSERPPWSKVLRWVERVERRGPTRPEPPPPPEDALPPPGPASGHPETPAPPAESGDHPLP